MESKFRTSRERIRSNHARHEPAYRTAPVADLANTSTQSCVNLHVHRHECTSPTAPSTAAEAVRYMKLQQDWLDVVEDTTSRQ